MSNLEKDFCKVIKLPRRKKKEMERGEKRWIISIRNAGELREEKPAGSESRRSLVFPHLLQQTGQRKKENKKYTIYIKLNEKKSLFQCFFEPSFFFASSSEESLFVI
jgi:hypothetical protein